ncbi:MAG: hypothetical protein IH969_08320 [Candidatus Krumholzibacteriota bacterium]|nr:hypothetical protein [Candidatus Krumholzibacteriota bacterium]
MSKNQGKISRRTVLTGVGVAAGATIAGLLPAKGRAPQSDGYAEAGHAGMHDMAVVGECEPGTVEQAERFLTHFDWGRETPLGDGRTLREYDFVAEDVEIGLFAPQETAGYCYRCHMVTACTWSAGTTDGVPRMYDSFLQKQIVDHVVRKRGTMGRNSAGEIRPHLSGAG